MILNPGDIVLVDCLHHPWHNRRVEVVEYIPDFNIAPDGVEPLVGPLVMVRLTRKLEPIGLGLSHIAGTVEAMNRRQWDARDTGEDGRQQELTL